MSELALNIVRQRMGQSPLFAYEESDITSAEVEYLQTEEGYSYQDAMDCVCQDMDLYSRAWDDFIADVDAWLEDHQGIFVVEATHLGWRNFSGYKVFAPNDGQDFVNKVVGLDTNHYTINIWESEECSLRATVAHHDSPTGESRYIYTLSDWLDGILAEHSIQKLQRFLTGWREREDGEGNIWGWDDEQILGKLRSKYTRKDFRDFLIDKHNGEMISDSDIYDPTEFIKFYLSPRKCIHGQPLAFA